MYEMERTLALAYKTTNDAKNARLFEQRASARKRAINELFWDSSRNWYVDHWFHQNKKGSLTIAGMMPFFLKIAPKERMEKAVNVLKERFLKEGGLVTTLVHSRQQWDAPNGWAPLQWISLVGLENYGQERLAKEVALRWGNLNIEVYERTGRLMEKYNVEDLGLEAGGGEYPTQDGFGWTNGVLRALLQKFAELEKK
jgi:alpha,alpha-trehalase